MDKKMYSFRLNKDLVDDAKRIAKEMGISLSLFISCLIKEKISYINSRNKNNSFFISNELTPQILREIVSEIRKLRSDLKKSLKK
jgi:antitoxin component of RelBE/YafQ-DinJ toxin-antitoxin module